MTIHNILVEASGSLVAPYLIKAIKAAGHNCVASDIETHSAGWFLADDFLLLPKASANNLWDEIKSVMSKVGLSTELKSVPYFLAYFIAKLHELKTSENSHEPAMTCYGVGVLNYSISLNIDKITNELGYKPVESSKQTLKDFVSWYGTDYKPNIEEL